MAAPRAFYYNKQLRRYLVQFMTIFHEMQVSVGKNDEADERLITVPIVNASKDRVVAAIKGGNTQNKPMRLPIFSCQITNLDLAPDRRKGVGNERRNTYLPTGGLFPDDIKVVSQRMPVPYNMGVDLNIWVSNQDQHYQIIEQITMLFDPDLVIQRSDDVFDWTRLTKVELTGIRFDENVPAGAERRLIQTTLSFEMPIYISVPAEVHDKYVKDIFIRLGAIDSTSNSSVEIIQDLDDQGIEYEQIMGLDNVDLNKEQ